MNATTFEGQGQTLSGNVKEAAGKATGDDQLRANGVADQFSGNAKQVIGAARDAVSNPAPLVGKAKAFAKERPWATAALVGTLGLALVNTLRGK